MKRQVSKILYYGEWKVIHDDTKAVNPYRVILNGKKVVDYADLKSCLCYLSEAVESHAEEVKRYL